jgi:adenosine deaminase
LLAQGLYVTLNSDDPPMFNTTLTNEYLLAQKTYGWDVETLQWLVLNAVQAALLTEQEKAELLDSFSAEFERLL